MNLTLVPRFLMREWRAGELRLLAVAVLLAVGTVTGISLFVDRLGRALLSESSTYLAADRVVASSRPIPEDFDAAARRLGLATTRTMTFPSMVFAGERNQLVSVKAVGDGYPLRGVLRLADAPFGASTPTQSLPGPGEAWLDSRLFPALGVAVGDTVTVGVADLRVTRVLADEPDRSGSLFDLGPRLLMRIDDVARTEIVKPGSRLSYRMLVAGDDATLERLHDALGTELGANYRWLGIRQSSPSIGSALDRAQSFLLLGGLLAVLLAGVAVALAAHRYARRHYDHVAILKTLGATPSQIQWGYLALLAVVGAVGAVAGTAFGALLHFAIVSALAAYMPLNLPAPGVKPLAIGAISGFVCLAAFGLPPLSGLKSISPMRVIRRDLDGGIVSKWVTYGCASAGTLGLLLWYTDSLRLTLWTIVGTGGVCAVFAAIAYGLLRAGRRVGMQAGSGWRLALAGLARRRGDSVAQILIFGLAIMLLLIMVLLRTALLEEWRTQLPEHAPNHFVMNVAPDEVEPLQAMVRVHAGGIEPLYPMTRGRIVAVNGEPVAEWERAHRAKASVDPGLEAERNLSWSATLPANNRIEAGAWWGGDSTEPAVSLEESYAASAGLNLGDTIEFDVGGLPVKGRVTSIRRVEWDSMAPNFFILFSPNALDEVPVTYMTSFYLAPEQKPWLNQLLAAFPTVTVIEVDKVIAQIQSIVGRVTQAVQLVLALVLVAGALVLVASIQASSDERLREHALLRALGASRRLVRGALGAEFAVLGAFAGAIAALGAEATVFALDKEVFQLAPRAHPWVWFAGPLLGALIVGLVGLIGTRTIVAAPPVRVLRALD
ncbi:MAG TPA: FtsX-like permease family protein [Pseudomonadales bacterium]|nr:FtsX-like permease family protein [Pseudomonadales bacterium]